MTITQVDIADFGSFKDFNWKKAIKDQGSNVLNFKRLNIIYGRNYSGKTTISRIFRSLQTGRIPINYNSPSFTIYGDKGEVNESGISAHGYEVRVYNRDFVTDNLSFLANQVDGEIKTFAIVGEINKDIENAIATIETQLGSVESKSGLKYELEEKRKENDSARNNHKSADDDLAEKLRNHAKFLKENKDYVPAVYTIRDIEADISKTKNPGFKLLSQEEINSKLALLKQEMLPDIPDNVTISLKLESLIATAEALLQRTITPTQPIQELLNDSILQLWVKDGMPHHRGKRDICAFCRQQLPQDVWQVLDSHFSKESTDLESEINSLISTINAEIKRIPTFLTISSDKFYHEERTTFEVSKKALDSNLEIYKQDLESLKSALETRKNSLFKRVNVPLTNHDPDVIEQHIEAINSLIEKNNSRTKTLDEDKTAARDSLRLLDVASFSSAISYDAVLKKVVELKTIANTANTTFIEVENKITKLEKEVTLLRGKQKDERKGAERVNALLNHFFGHDGIKLEAQDSADKTAIKFQIMRDGNSAFNLSEGECSLIAFCYFIAKLEEPESKGKDLIIYIDDPISSLDGNHIFFMFSLIESLIAKPIKNEDGSNHYRYCVFLPKSATHNNRKKATYNNIKEATHNSRKKATANIESDSGCLIRMTQ